MIWRSQSVDDINFDKSIIDTITENHPNDHNQILLETLFQIIISKLTKGQASLKLECTDLFPVLSVLRIQNSRF